jgi:hypothetical protein
MVANIVTTATVARVYDPRLSPLRQAALAAERRYKERCHSVLHLSASATRSPASIATALQPGFLCNQPFTR